MNGHSQGQRYNDVRRTRRQEQGARDFLVSAWDKWKGKTAVVTFSDFCGHQISMLYDVICWMLLSTRTDTALIINEYWRALMASPVTLNFQAMTYFSLT